MNYKRLSFDPQAFSLLEKKLKTPDPRWNRGYPKLEEILPTTLWHEQFAFQGPDDNELIVSVIRKKDSDSFKNGNQPCVYHIHGGGMISGNRFANIQWPFKVVEQFDAVCVTIEYRLAPAHPDPALVEDCYAGLLWTHQHAAQLGIDPTRILVNGVSAGGGIAAGMILICRDRKGPKLLGQVLFAPMLDDRSDSISAHQFEGVGVWDRQENVAGWTALLGERRGTEEVSIYASPTRATDLTELPPTFIDVGSAETFRDEDVQFAQSLWRDGVQCELHVWPGGFHGFDILAPDSKIAIRAEKTRMDWVRRLFQDDFTSSSLS